MKSHGSLSEQRQQQRYQQRYQQQPHQPQEHPSPPSPRPLQLLAECSLAIASRPQLRFTQTFPQTQTQAQVPGFCPASVPLRTDEYRGKRMTERIMDPRQPSADFQPQEQQKQQKRRQEQQGGRLLLLFPTAPCPIPCPSEDTGLNTLICAAQSSPYPTKDAPPPSTSPRPIPTLPLPPGAKLSSSSSSLYSSPASSCCEIDDCTSKCPSECDVEDCTEPCTEPCGGCIPTPCDLTTACQIVPVLCSEKTCLGPKAPCPEGETCVQEIICQKDGCEVTSCHSLTDYTGYALNGLQSLVEPANSWGLQSFGHDPDHLLHFDYNTVGQQQQQQQQQHSKDLQQLDYSQQQFFTFPNQQQLNNHIQAIATSEPPSSSRSSSAFLESYDSFSSVSPFDHDYSVPTKRRRISTPLNSPPFEVASKSSTPFGEPIAQWPSYGSQTPWNENDILGDGLDANNIFTLPLELGECHWDGCNAHLDTKSDLQLHLSTHFDPSLDQCLWDACGIEVEGIEELKSHLRHEHLVPAAASVSVSTPASASTPVEEGEGEEEVRRCEWEDRGSSAEVRVCGKEFGSTEELQRHAKEAHIAALKKKTGYYCRWAGCGRKERGFSQKGKVERHMQTHTGFKSCKCNYCDKEFSATQALQQHIRIHTGEKPYKCDVCQKEFAQGSALTMHKRVHTGDRPLKCEFPGCGKRFSESSNLSKHRKTHLSVGQHRCWYPECDRTFHRLDQMKRHQKVHGTVVSSTSNMFSEPPYAPPSEDFSPPQPTNQISQLSARGNNIN